MIFGSDIPDDCHHGDYNGMLLEHSATKLLANDSNAKSLMPGARRTTKRRPAGFLGNRSIGCTALLVLTAVLYSSVLM